MSWDSTGNTIFYTSDLSLNTEYSLSSNAVFFNALASSNSVAVYAKTGIFNVSPGVNSINSEMYIANVSTNSIILSALAVYKHLNTTDAAPVIDTDTQVWIG